MKKIIIFIGIVLIITGVWWARRGSTVAQSPTASTTETVAETTFLNFTHPTIGFNFSYPPTYQLSLMQDDASQSVLVQKEGKGMQIYISDFSGGTLNASLVKKEVTDVVLEHVQDIGMPAGVSAVSFSYKDVSLGEVWNVWFVHSKKMYQVTCQAGNDEVLKMFVETFRVD